MKTRMNKNEIMLKFHRDIQLTPMLTVDFGNYHPNHIGRYFDNIQMWFLARQMVRKSRRKIVDIIYPFCKEFVHEYEMMVEVERLRKDNSK